MKKVLVFTFAALLLGAISTRTEEAVSSRNAVGFVKFTVNPGELVMVSNPFEPLEPTGFQPKTILQGLLPPGTEIFFWNKELQAYDIHTYITGTIWNPPAPIVVSRGESFFVKAANTATSATEIMFYGEVPGAASKAETSIPLVEGVNAVAVSYPYEVTIEDSGIQSVTEPGDEVFFWDVNAQAYDIATKITSTIWNPPNKTIPMGRGFFIKKKNAGIYREAVPYSWPNN